MRDLDCARTCSQLGAVLAWHLANPRARAGVCDTLLRCISLFVALFDRARTVTNPSALSG